jgi:hypothetical protein
MWQAEGESPLLTVINDSGLRASGDFAHLTALSGMWCAWVTKGRGLVRDKVRITSGSRPKYCQLSYLVTQ